MGTTGVIDRNSTAKRDLWGMEAEIIASDEQCGSENLLYVYAVLAPGQHTSVMVHDDCEVAWYMVTGDTVCILGNLDDDEFDAVECSRGSAGYVASGELHMQFNRSTTQSATFLMAHVGINSAAAAAGRNAEVPATLHALLQEHGLTVPTAEARTER
jgi:uncharacterized RmlC-like cupin family protein